MKLLLTGAEGYIGSVMAPLLQRRGHEVIGLDTGYYRNGMLYNDGRDRPIILNRDIRKVAAEDLQGFDAIVHLAELSNDPLGEQNPDITFDINHRGSLTLARAAKAAGIQRFVYASSCSVYGAGADDVKVETSAPNPQTAYAKCKVLVERDVSAMADDDFSPTFLRNATAFGASPRIRFDVVLNNLAGLAWTTGQIKLTSDGTPWRPLVHILDISKAVACALEAPREAVHNEIFNVGSEEQNYRIRAIADIIARAFPDCEISLGTDHSDNRSYRVSFEKIRKHMPEFSCDWTADRGAQQLHDLFEHIDMSESVFRYPAYVRLQQLRHLIETGQIDKDFYWKSYDLQ